jgi:hypothetical protein
MQLTQSEPDQQQDVKDDDQEADEEMHQDKDSEENQKKDEEQQQSAEEENDQERSSRNRRKPKVKRSLRITEWNVRSVNAQENKLALKRYLANHHPDILILVETWARVDINFENDGYLVHQTVLAAHQGVAILAKEEFSIKKILSLGTRLLAVEVKSPDWTHPLTVVGSYH